jgi:hypothetical protein
MKAVPPPQLKPKPNAPAVPEMLLAQFQADGAKWLTLNSNLHTSEVFKTSEVYV